MSQCHDLYERVEKPSAAEGVPGTQCHDHYPEWLVAADRGNAPETVMYAEPGDRIIVKGHHIGEPNRDCRVIVARGPDGRPPYVVRWEDCDHDTLYYPGPDATVHRYAPTRG